MDFFLILIIGLLQQDVLSLTENVNLILFLSQELLFVIVFKSVSLQAMSIRSLI